MLHSKSAISELFHKPLHAHMGKVEGGRPSNMTELNVRSTIKAIKFYVHKKKRDTVCVKKV